MLSQLNEQRQYGPEITRENILDLLNQFPDNIPTPNDTLIEINGSDTIYDEYDNVRPGRESWPNQEDVESGRVTLSDKDPRFDPNVNGHVDTERGKEYYIYCAIAREIDQKEMAECLTGKWICDEGVCIRD